MSKALARLLEQPEAAIAKLVTQLEDKNGYPSHDVRAVSENIQKIRRKVDDLGLDPDDTTAEELYQALLVKFETDARRFDEHFVLHGQTYDEKIQKAVQLVSKNVITPEVWVLKNTAAKQLLHQHPPKQVMKRLHYRSVESLIKRENMAEIYLAVEFVESPAWNKIHFKLASGLDTTAFENRRLQLKALTSRWGSQLADDPRLSSSDYGVLGLSPTSEVSQMSSLALVAVLLDEVGAEPSVCAKLSTAAAWWADTDGCVAELDNRPVTLNLKDIAQSYAKSAGLGDHFRSNAQNHFWKQLLSRYQVNSDKNEGNLSSWEAPVLELKNPLNQPAFEYVEAE